ncbi:MAG: amidase [Acidimicrobiia bacterium]|nr:amidase [Acidimicrobiia bacterium]
MGTSSPLAFAPAVECLAMLASGEVSSRELLDMYLERNTRFGGTLNAVVTFDADRARARAAAADDAHVRGESWGPLHGLPMTVKDELPTAGIRSTYGSPRHSGNVPDADSVPVRRLRAAGAVIFGKTNLPAYGSDVQTYNRLFGTTNNPWDVTRTPGGSSGGAAAALAAGLTALEVGTDIGGSIRTPAAYCGVYGHKPTWGIVPNPGRVDDPPGYYVECDIATAGPMGRSAADLDLGLGVLAGPDDDTAVAWRLDLPAPRHGRLDAFRVAAWLDDPSCPTEPEVLETLVGAVASLREAGVRVDETARPPFPLSRAYDVYRRLLYSSLSRAMPAPSALAPLAHLLPPGHEVLRAARAYGVSHAKWLAWNEERRQLQEGWAGFFREWDVLITPVTPVLPLHHDHRYPLMIMRDMPSALGAGTRPYIDQLAWVGAVGGCYLPATSAPVGQAASGLPVGVQVVGPYLEDRTPLAFARLMAAVLGGFTPPPGY